MAGRVLLTGANGFIGQHILAFFLDAGHSVRSVVRSQAKADQLAKTFSEFASSSQLDFSIVPDMTSPGAFDQALESEPPFEWVVHTASPFNYSKVTSNRDFLDPAVKGTTEILQAIKRNAPSVKRLVLTSSMAAVIDFAAPKSTHPAKVYTEADWNPTSWETALVTENKNLAYQASKKYAEKAAWDFVAANPDGFDLAVINPPMVYGPLYVAAQFSSPAQLNQSTSNIYNALLNPALSADSPMPPTGLHLYVDVRDVARAHLLAAATPAAGGKRFIACGGQLSFQRIANLLRASLPALSGRIPRGTPEEATMPEGSFEASSELARTVLGLDFRSAEDTIGDLATQLVDIESRGALS